MVDKTKPQKLKEVRIIHCRFAKVMMMQLLQRLYCLVNCPIGNRDKGAPQKRHKVSLSKDSLLLWHKPYQQTALAADRKAWHQKMFQGNRLYESNFKTRAKEQRQHRKYRTADTTPPSFIRIALYIHVGPMLLYPI